MAARTQFHHRAKRARGRGAQIAIAAAAMAGVSSSAHGLNRGQQWFVDNGLQIMGLIGDPSRTVPFHLSTYQSMGYTTQLWEWHTDASQLTTSWGRWVSSPSDMPPQGAESSHMGTLKHLGLGDEEDLNTLSVRDQWVAWYNSAHANPTYNGVLLWNNNWGGQITDAALGDFISRAAPDMISFDTYPYAPSSQPGGGSPTNWYGSFRQYRQWGMDTNTPVGFYRQTYASASGSPQTRVVSQSELSLETFAGLAFNAKSIEDFTYNFSGTTLFVGGSGDGTLTPLGTAAKTMNAEAKRLGPALVRLKPVTDQTTPSYTSSMMFIRGKTAASTYNALPIGFVVDPQNGAYSDWVKGRNDPYMLEPTTANNLGAKNGGLPGDIIVSWFNVLDESMDGAWANEKYFMVVNGLVDMNATETETRQSVTLNFDFGSSGITQLQRLTRTTGLVEDVNLSSLGGSLYAYTLTLDGGRGDLFKFKDGAPFVGIESVPQTGTMYWDNDGTASGNSTVNGNGTGGSGTWNSASTKWFNGSADVVWSAPSDAVFWGTAGTVTFSSAFAANSLTFKTSGYMLTSSTITLANDAIVTTDSNVTATIASTVAGSAGLTKAGAGILVLTNASNSYTGGTTVNDGVLRISGDGNLGAVPTSAASNITLDGGTLQWGANFDLSNNRGITLGASGGTIDTQSFTNTSGYTWNNGIQGAGDLTKIGSGTFFMNVPTGQVNTVWTGNLIIEEGIWKTANSGGLPVNPTTGGLRAAQVTLDGGTLQFNAANFISQPNRGITVSAGGGAIDTQGFNVTWAGPIAGTSAGATLTKLGSGILRLNSATYTSGYVGNVSVNQGTLQLDGGGAMGDLASVNLSNASGVVLNITGNETIGSLGGGGASGGDLTLGSITLTTGGNNNSTTFAGDISGSGGITKTGSGLMALSGINTSTGATTINGGTLRVSGGNAIGDSSAVTLANTSDASLNVKAAETIGSLSGGGSSGGNLALGSDTLTTGGINASTTFAGAISGAAGSNLTKTGSGTMVIDEPSPRSGATSAWLSNLTISTGTLQIGNGNATGFLPGYDPVAYAGLPPTVPTIAVATGAALRLNSSNGHNNAVAITGAGSVVVAGSGIQTLVADSTYTGPTTINSGATLRIGFGGASNGGSLGATAIANSGTLIFFRDNDSTFSGSISGSGSLTKEGTGKLVLTGSNSSVGSATISGGTLQIGSGGARVLVAGGLSIGPGAKLDLTDNDMIVKTGGVMNVRALIMSGFNGGDWNGHGIVTTGAAPSGKKVLLGYAQGDDPGITGLSNSLGGVTFAADSNHAIVKFTYQGDADLDGDVDGIDIAAWATGFTGNLGFPVGTLTPSKLWTQGDWDYDGDVDGMDVSLWANNFTGSGGGVLGGDFDFGHMEVFAPNASASAAAMLASMGITVVPEPAGAGLMALAATALIRRRRTSTLFQCHTR